MPSFAHGDITLHYDLRGEGPPVLLIQGVGVVGNGWRPQVDELHDRYALCSFDNRGIGRSIAPKGPTSIEAMAADALALLDHLGWERAHVVGHSMGGLIAEQLALDAPKRVRSLALLCTPASGHAGARPPLGVLWIGLRGRVGTRAMRRAAFCELVMPRSHLADADRQAMAERLAPLFGRDLADNPAIVMQQVRAMSKHDVRSRLGELAAIPTLVLSAVEDRIAPPQAGSDTASRIPGARHVVLDDAAHGVTISHPTEVDALLDEHFRSAG
jgi:aminoacrylate hydrolase